jgi:hypothetical protein
MTKFVHIQACDLYISKKSFGHNMDINNSHTNICATHGDMLKFKCLKVTDMILKF